MGVSGEDKFDGGNSNREQMNYNSPNLSSDWAFNALNNLTNTPINPMDNTASASTSMVDSFWDHQATNSQTLGGFCDMNLQNNSTGFRKNNLFAPLRTHDMFLPPAASTMPPTDSGFVRFPCFHGGNFGNMINPLGNMPVGSYSGRVNGLESGYGEGSKDLSMSVDSDGSQLKNERQSESFVRSLDGKDLGDEVELRDGSGDVGQKESSNEGFGSKKRRRNGQDAEYDKGEEAPRAPNEATKIDEEGQQKGNEVSNLVTNKSNGKHGKSGSQASDANKEGYIHVRARRGQATNSHSLAERVRREKISERMKFLQDLVPGCNKVTGKAVMLDEIINYVQSLQKQVEFLSMKLATVNPRMDFNIEALLSKDLHQSQPGPSGTLGFSPDITMPYPLPFHLSQTGITQAGLSGVGSSSDPMRRTIHSHLTTLSGGYKSPTSQVAHAWNDELHNFVQNPSAPLGSQDLGSTPPSHSKAESYKST